MFAKDNVDITKPDRGFIHIRVRHLDLFAIGGAQEPVKNNRNEYDRETNFKALGNIDLVEGAHRWHTETVRAA